MLKYPVGIWSFTVGQNCIWYVVAYKFPDIFVRADLCVLERKYTSWGWRCIINVSPGSKRMGAFDSNVFVDLSFFRVRVGDCFVGLLVFVVWDGSFDFRFGRGGGADDANGLFSSSQDALFFPFAASFRFFSSSNCFSFSCCFASMDRGSSKSVSCGGGVVDVFRRDVHSLIYAHCSYTSALLRRNIERWKERKWIDICVYGFLDDDVVDSWITENQAVP